MNSTGIVITYEGQTYDGRLVNFTADTATASDSLDAISYAGRQSGNFIFTLIGVLVCAAGLLVVFLTVVIIVAKVCRITFLVLVFSPTSSIGITMRYDTMDYISMRPKADK